MPTKPRGENGGVAHVERKRVDRIAKHRQHRRRLRLDGFEFESAIIGEHATTGFYTRNQTHLNR